MGGGTNGLAVACARGAGRLQRAQRAYKLQGGCSVGERKQLKKDSGRVTSKGKGVWALLAEGLLRSLRLQRGVSMGVVFLNVTVEKK